jgi:hypothetical protein
MAKSWRILLSVGLLVTHLSSWGQDASFVVPEIKNAKNLATQLKVAVFKGKKFQRKIKVAILDNGWTGHEAAIGKSLPAGTVYHNGKASDADLGQAVNFHGVIMAKTIAAILRESQAETDVEMHLINSFGYTKFADAVDRLINDKFDLVLYSQVWEFGGNGDGKGFINAQVDRAVKAGVVWVNAAGNFGKLTRLAKVDGKVEGETEWVVFKDTKGKAASSAKFKCATVAKEQCTVKLVLAWNDFKDDPETGTDKDLDLIILDKSGNQVGMSERNQRLKSDAADKTVSIIPRELIEVKLASGTYDIRVKIKSKNFSATQDQLRLNLSGSGVTLEQPSLDETLLAPADNPGVIVVGASDDPQSSSSKKLNKPDIKLKSLIELDNGSKPFASSNAAALAAGVAILHMGTGQASTVAEVIEKLKPLTQKSLVPSAERSPSAPPVSEARRAAPSAAPARVSQPRTDQRRDANLAQQAYSPYQPRFRPERSRIEGSEEGLRCIESFPGVRLFPQAQRLIEMGGALRSNQGRWIIRLGPELIRELRLEGLLQGRRIVISPSGFRDLMEVDPIIGPASIELRPTRYPVCK